MQKQASFRFSNREDLLLTVHHITCKSRSMIASLSVALFLMMLQDSCELSLSFGSLLQSSEPPTHFYIIAPYITPFFLEPILVFTVAKCNREYTVFSLLQQKCQRFEYFIFRYLPMISLITTWMNMHSLLSSHSSWHHQVECLVMAFQ